MPLLVWPEKKTLKKAYPMKLLNHFPVMTKISPPHLGKPIKKNERSGSLAGRNKWTCSLGASQNGRGTCSWNAISKLPKVPQRKFSKRNAIRNSQGRRCRELRLLASIPLLSFTYLRPANIVIISLPMAHFETFLRAIHLPIRNLWIKLRNSQNEKVFPLVLGISRSLRKGGFDCILGNPPYLGGQKLSSFYGDSFIGYIRSTFTPAKGWSDLVTYFARRIYVNIKQDGFMGLITTKTIAEGDTCEGGLVQICKTGNIIFANRSMIWPGAAAVHVTVLSLVKGDWIHPRL